MCKRPRPVRSEIDDVLDELVRLRAVYGLGSDWTREARVVLEGWQGRWVAVGVRWSVGERVLLWIEANPERAVTHDVLAEEIGTQRETVSRAVGELVGAGKVERRRPEPQRRPEGDWVPGWVHYLTAG